MIKVTKPYIPNIKKYQSLVEHILKSGQLTNDGPFCVELEDRLKEFLGVRNVILVSNGTTALQSCYVALGLQGGVLTSPFSFVATASSIKWQGLEPHFIDIEEGSLNINPSLIKRNLNSSISAVVPVHVYGNPCSIEDIDKIAQEERIRVIYDAAHAFGVNYNGKSILRYGDASTLSFHATKLFHTMEGGAIVTENDDLAKAIREIKNFGIEDYEIKRLGVNFKMSEMHAAMGVCVLDDINLILEKREEIWSKYKTSLQGYLELQERLKGSSNNYSYFPCVFKNKREMQRVNDALENEKIFPRRYFSPSLDTVEALSGLKKRKTPVSRDISDRVLCLPIYPELALEDVDRIINIIKQSLLTV